MADNSNRERVYNIDAKDSLVFVATSSGLWKSLDGENWARFDPAIEMSLLNQRQILTNTVYAVNIDDRDTIPKLWIGTPDGVGLAPDIQGSTWEIFQANHDPTEVYAYPNPFSPLSHNQLDNDDDIDDLTKQIENEKRNAFRMFFQVSFSIFSCFFIFSDFC